MKGTAMFERFFWRRVRTAAAPAPVQSAVSATPDTALTPEEQERMDRYNNWGVTR